MVSRYQKGKTNLDFTEARDSEWQWHQLGHMQVSTLLTWVVPEKRAVKRVCVCVLLFFDPGTQFPGNEKIMLCNTNKYENQAGINLTPLAPYYYYYHLTASFPGQPG